jgi:N-acetylglucosaminyldiphosphoundecaprenol N-acetyl-beta-D-mannosaminyltransferase
VPLLLSDIKVHREQNPSACLYFDPMNIDDLVQSLIKGWSEWGAGPRLESEQNALNQTKRLRIEFAQQFIKIVHDMVWSATEDILDYAVDSCGGVICVQAITEWVSSGDHCRWLACLNPHSYVVACDDRAFSTALHNADWLIPDGAGIVLASKILGGTIRVRVTGSDIFWGLHKALNRQGGVSVFFLGSTEGTLAMIVEKMARDFPNIRVAGTYSPPYKSEFSEEDNRLMVAAVNQARPDVLWVGLTAPKQEKWIYQNREQLDAKFIAAVGAVFDFYTGKVNRSHPLFQKLGLEWLPRLLQEPRRLFRRNFISSPLFLLRVFARKFGLTKKNHQ